MSPAITPAATSPARRTRFRAAVVALTTAPLVLTTAVVPAALAASPTAAPADPVQVSRQTPNPADPLNPTNPLAGRQWGNYKGSADPAWEPYLHAHGTKKKLLGYIVNHVKAKWFGRWLSAKEIQSKVHEYIKATQAGNPGALVQMTLFDVDPWEQQACTSLPTKAEQQNYHRWINNTAKAIGHTHVAIILQPDGPFAQCAPHHSLAYSKLIAWSAHRLAKLPHAAVYIDMGSGDWTRDNLHRAVSLLLDDGIADKHVRGFSTDITHYSPTAAEIQFGARVVTALAQHGAAGKHFVVDTADNGKPFTGKWWSARHKQPISDAQPCHKAKQTHCVAIGIPPTTDVANPKWGMSKKVRHLAAKDVDGYLWINRPWVDNSNEKFEMQRALQVVRYSPWR